MSSGSTRTTTRIWAVGITICWMNACWLTGSPSAIHVAEDDVDRSDDRDHVGDETPLAHGRQRLEVHERGGAEADAVRHLPALVHEIEPLLPARALDHVVHLARGGLDVLR